MDPLTMGLITGGAGLLGSIFNSSTTASNTQAQIAAQQQMLGQTEQFNAAQVQQQEQFQTQMSNTAYQRASQDMQAAGLNPMMMFGSGGAASSPGGSSASVGTPSVPMPQKTSPFAQLGQSVSSAVDAMVRAKTVDKMTQEISNLQTQQGLTAAQTASEAQRPALIQAETGLTGERAKDVAQTIAIRRPEELEARGTTGIIGEKKLGDVGAVKYGAGTLGDIVGQFVGNAIGVKRMFAPMGRRSTVERSSTGPAGDTSSFEERFNY